MKKTQKSIAAVLTLFFFLASNVAGYAAPDVALGTAIEGRGVSSFSLNIPADLGTIENLRSGSGPALIHIQTAHGNYEAQKKIQGILEYLKSNYGIKLVLLEGSAFKFDSSYLRLFPDQMEVTRDIADKLTQQAFVKGAELFLLNNPDVQAYGIEKIDTYRAGGEAFKAVLTQQQKTEGFLTDMNMQIDRLTAPYLNKDLRSFLARHKDFEDKKIQLMDWLTYLRSQTEKYLNYDLADAAYQIEWPMLVRLFTLTEFEKKMDMAAYAQEKPEFLKAVKKLPAAIAEPIEKLLNAPVSRHQLADPETGILFENMVASLPADFDYSRFPNVKLFIGHLILQSEINSEVLMAEIDRLVSVISQRLAQSAEEKKLLTLLNDYRLLEKLFSLVLTPKDYEKLLSRGEEARPDRVAERFLEMNGPRRVRDVKFEHLDEINELRDKALEFYRLVKKRDEEMTVNIEDRVKETGADKAVVITGGFHAQPFEDFFAGQGYAYALISPKITSIEGDGGRKAYIDSILQDMNYNKQTHEAAYGFAHDAADTAAGGINPYFVAPYVVSDADAAFSAAGQTLNLEQLGGRLSETKWVAEQLGGVKLSYGANNTVNLVYGNGGAATLATGRKVVTVERARAILPTVVSSRSQQAPVTSFNLTEAQIDADLTGALAGARSEIRILKAALLSAAMLAGLGAAVQEAPAQDKKPGIEKIAEATPEQLAKLVKTGNANERLEAAKAISVSIEKNKKDAKIVALLVNGLIDGSLVINTNIEKYAADTAATNNEVTLRALTKSMDDENLVSSAITEALALGGDTAVDALIKEVGKADVPARLLGSASSALAKMKAGKAVPTLAKALTTQYDNLATRKEPWKLSLYFYTIASVSQAIQDIGVPDEKGIRALLYVREKERNKVGNPLLSDNARNGLERLRDKITDKTLRGEVDADLKRSEIRNPQGTIDGSQGQTFNFGAMGGIVEFAMQNDSSYNWRLVVSGASRQAPREVTVTYSDPDGVFANPVFTLAANVETSVGGLKITWDGAESVTAFGSVGLRPITYRRSEMRAVPSLDVIQPQLQSYLDEADDAMAEVFLDSMVREFALYGLSADDANIVRAMRTVNKINARVTQPGGDPKLKFNALLDVQRPEMVGDYTDYLGMYKDDHFPGIDLNNVVSIAGEKRAKGVKLSGNALSFLSLIQKGLELYAPMSEEDIAAGKKEIIIVSGDGGTGTRALGYTISSGGVKGPIMVLGRNLSPNAIDQVKLLAETLPPGQWFIPAPSDNLLFAVPPRYAPGRGLYLYTNPFRVFTDILPDGSPDPNLVTNAAGMAYAMDMGNVMVDPEMKVDEFKEKPKPFLPLFDLMIGYAAQKWYERIGGKVDVVTAKTALFAQFAQYVNEAELMPGELRAKQRNYMQELILIPFLLAGPKGEEVWKEIYKNRDKGEITGKAFDPKVTEEEWMQIRVAAQKAVKKSPGLKKFLDGFLDFSRFTNLNTFYFAMNRGVAEAFFDPDQGYNRPRTPQAGKDDPGTFFEMTGSTVYGPDNAVVKQGTGGQLDWSKHILTPMTKTREEWIAMWEKAAAPVIEDWIAMWEIAQYIKKQAAPGISGGALSAAQFGRFWYDTGKVVDIDAFVRRAVQTENPWDRLFTRATMRVPLWESEINFRREGEGKVVIQDPKTTLIINSRINVPEGVTVRIDPGVVIDHSEIDIVVPTGVKEVVIARGTAIVLSSIKGTFIGSTPKNSFYHFFFEGTVDLNRGRPNNFAYTVEVNDKGAAKLPADKGRTIIIRHKSDGDPKSTAAVAVEMIDGTPVPNISFANDLLPEGAKADGRIFDFGPQFQKSVELIQRLRRSEVRAASLAAIQPKLQSYLDASDANAEAILQEMLAAPGTYGLTVDDAAIVRAMRTANRINSEVTAPGGSANLKFNALLDVQRPEMVDPYTRYLGEFKDDHFPGIDLNNVVSIAGEKSAAGVKLSGNALSFLSLIQKGLERYPRMSNEDIAAGKREIIIVSGDGGTGTRALGYTISSGGVKGPIVVLGRNLSPNAIDQVKLLSETLPPGQWFIPAPSDNLLFAVPPAYAKDRGLFLYTNRFRIFTEFQADGTPDPDLVVNAAGMAYAMDMGNVMVDPEMKVDEFKEKPKPFLQLFDLLIGYAAQKWYEKNFGTKTDVVSAKTAFFTQFAQYVNDAALMPDAEVRGKQRRYMQELILIPFLLAGPKGEEVWKEIYKNRSKELEGKAFDPKLNEEEWMKLRLSAQTAIIKRPTLKKFLDDFFGFARFTNLNTFYFAMNRNVAEAFFDPDQGYNRPRVQRDNLPDPGTFFEMRGKGTGGQMDWSKHILTPMTKTLDEWMAMWDKAAAPVQEDWKAMWEIAQYIKKAAAPGIDGGALSAAQFGRFWYDTGKVVDIDAFVRRAVQTENPWDRIFTRATMRVPLWESQVNSQLEGNVVVQDPRTTLIINSRINVPAGVTLRIEPGVIIDHSEIDIVVPDGVKEVTISRGTAIVLSSIKGTFTGINPKNSFYHFFYEGVVDLNRGTPNNFAYTVEVNDVGAAKLPAGKGRTIIIRHKSDGEPSSTDPVAVEMPDGTPVAGISFGNDFFPKDDSKRIFDFGPQFQKSVELIQRLRRSELRETRDILDAEDVTRTPEIIGDEARAVKPVTDIREPREKEDLRETPEVETRLPERREPELLGDPLRKQKIEVKTGERAGGERGRGTRVRVGGANVSPEDEGQGAEPVITIGVSTIRPLKNVTGDNNVPAITFYAAPITPASQKDMIVSPIIPVEVKGYFVAVGPNAAGQGPELLLADLPQGQGTVVAGFNHRPEALFPNLPPAITIAGQRLFESRQPVNGVNPVNINLPISPRNVNLPTGSLQSGTPAEFTLSALPGTNVAALIQARSELRQVSELLQQAGSGNSVADRLAALNSLLPTDALERNSQVLLGSIELIAQNVQERAADNREAIEVGRSTSFLLVANAPKNISDIRLLRDQKLYDNIASSVRANTFPISQTLLKTAINGVPETGDLAVIKVLFGILNSTAPLTSYIQENRDSLIAIANQLLGIAENRENPRDARLIALQTLAPIFSLLSRLDLSGQDFAARLINVIEAERTLPEAIYSNLAEARQALAAIGEQALPAVVGQIDKPGVTPVAADILTQTGASAAPLVDIAVSGDSSLAQKLAALDALKQAAQQNTGVRSPIAQRIFPQAVISVLSRDGVRNAALPESLRVDAARVLSTLGPAAVSALNELKEVAEETAGNPGLATLNLIATQAAIAVQGRSELRTLVTTSTIAPQPLTLTPPAQLPPAGRIELPAELQTAAEQAGITDAGIFVTKEFTAFVLRIRNVVKIFAAKNIQTAVALATAVLGREAYANVITSEASTLTVDDVLPAGAYTVTPKFYADLASVPAQLASTGQGVGRELFEHDLLMLLAKDNPASLVTLLQGFSQLQPAGQRQLLATFIPEGTTKDDLFSALAKAVRSKKSGLVSTEEQNALIAKFDGFIEAIPLLKGQNATEEANKYAAANKGIARIGGKVVDGIKNAIQLGIDAEIDLRDNRQAIAVVLAALSMKRAADLVVGMDDELLKADTISEYVAQNLDGLKKEGNGWMLTKGNIAQLLRFMYAVQAYVETRA